MILKRINKIYRLTILIALRQLWGLGCTLYLLTYQPYLTLKNIFIESKDKSQIALLIMTAISPAIVYGILRLVWDLYHYSSLLPAVGDVFAGMLVIEIVIWVYLGYWTWRVFKKRNEKLETRN